MKVISEGQLVECVTIPQQDYDSLRSRLEAAEKARDNFRKVLEGAGYEQLDRLAAESRDTFTVGLEARRRTLEMKERLEAAERERDALINLGAEAYKQGEENGVAEAYAQGQRDMAAKAVQVAKCAAGELELIGKLHPRNSPERDRVFARARAASYISEAISALPIKERKEGA